ncbi:MAG: hypothetical protein Q8T03_05800 [Bacteroidota bacterium]|nr:hypothetical protein [Bacteroidota bacterium]MDP3556868.1 hypothetical protein [Bacteroidota bacterium]
MKEIELREIENDNNKETKGELTLEKARGLLGTNENNKPLSDEQLEKIINSIKVFCKVAYELYSEEQNQKLKNEHDTIVELYPIEGEQEQLKEAA